MADVLLKYKDVPFAEMNASGTKILKTAGKYCEGNIAVEYVQSRGYTLPFDVPKDYQRLEYLDTGNVNCRVNVSHSYTSSDVFCVKISGEGPFIGNRNNWNMNASTISQSYVVYGTTLLDLSWRHDWYDANDPACVAFRATLTPSSFDLGSWGNDYKFDGKIYFCYVLSYAPIIESDNSLINWNITVSLCLVPCYRKSDGVNGFYDTIHDVFYTSVSGTFIRGPEVAD